MSNRFTIPDVGAPSAIVFPPVDRRTLGNGLRVWMLHQPDTAVVTIACVADAGTAADPSDRPGLSSLVAALMTEGAGGRDAIALSDALARIGGQLETETGTDAASATLTVLPRHFRTGLGLIADIVQRPRLEAADFARVRDLRLSRLKQIARTPGAAADRALLAATYGSHPYGHGALGTTRSVEGITLDDVRSAWRALWQPASTVLVIAGDLGIAEVRREAEDVFGGWSSGATSREEVVSPALLSSGELLVVDRPLAPQSEVRVGHVGPPRSTSDYHAVVTLNAIVGGMFTSRINRNLREARAITYGARSAFDMRRAGGLFAVESSVQSDATSIALTEVLAELANVRAVESVTAAELRQAQASLTRGYVRHFETSGQLVRALAQLAAYQLPDDTFDRFVPGVEALNEADITDAARRHIHPELAVMVVVGDLEKLEKPLTSLGRSLRIVKPEF